MTTNVEPAPPPPPHTSKRYKCDRCGHITTQSTNHHGPTYSWGHMNTCPTCPPWAKYPEYGGATSWTCLDAPPEPPPRPRPRHTGRDCIHCGLPMHREYVPQTDPRTGEVRNREVWRCECGSQRST